MYSVKFWVLLLKALDTLNRFPALFYKGKYFCDFLFTFLYIKPILKKVVYSTRRESAPNWSTFTFRVDRLTQLDKFSRFSTTLKRETNFCDSFLLSYASVTNTTEKACHGSL